MKTTSSAIRLRTVARSPVLLADIHVSINCRMARSSLVILRSNLNVASAEVEHGHRSAATAR